MKSILAVKGLDEELKVACIKCKSVMMWEYGGEHLSIDAGNLGGQSFNGYWRCLECNNIVEERGGTK